MSEGALKSTCHCGAVELALNMPNGLEDMRRCNCSMCSRRGTIAATVHKDDLAVVRGADKLSLYQFNTNTAKHYFCSVCGIYTHHQRRSFPDTFGVNIACIEGVDPYAQENVPITDGRNHLRDRKTAP